MIIIRQLGGLGNQLFIHAFGEALECKYNVDVRYDIISGYKKDVYKRKYKLDKLFGKIKKANLYYSLFFPIYKRFRYLCYLLYPNSRYIDEKQFDLNYLEKIIYSKKKIFLEGYWQKSLCSTNIIQNYKIKNQIKNNISVYVNNYAAKLRVNKSVALHVRRVKITDKVSLSYYKEAIDYINKILINPTYYCFSDDIYWCKQNIINYPNFNYIDFTRSELEDLWLMSNCSHFIISNSTFSLWGALLGAENSSLIILPETEKNKSIQTQYFDNYNIKCTYI